MKRKREPVVFPLPVYHGICAMDDCYGVPAFGLLGRAICATCLARIVDDGRTALESGR